MLYSIGKMVAILIDQLNVVLNAFLEMYMVA